MALKYINSDACYAIGIEFLGAQVSPLGGKKRGFIEVGRTIFTYRNNIQRIICWKRRATKGVSRHCNKNEKKLFLTTG